MSGIVSRRGSLGIIVNQYHGAVTRWARRNGYSAFAWQPRYHDRVIRSEAERERIRQYIEENLGRWGRDRLRPAS